MKNDLSLIVSVDGGGGCSPIEALNKRKMDLVVLVRQKSSAKKKPAPVHVFRATKDLNRPSKSLLALQCATVRIQWSVR